MSHLFFRLGRSYQTDVDRLWSTDLQLLANAVESQNISKTVQIVFEMCTKLPSTIESRPKDSNFTCPKFDLNTVGSLATFETYISCQFTGMVFSLITFLFARLIDARMAVSIAKKAGINKTLIHEFPSPTLTLVFHIFVHFLIAKSSKTQEAKIEKKNSKVTNEIIMQELQSIKTTLPISDPKTQRLPQNVAAKNSELLLPTKYTLPKTHTKDIRIQVHPVPKNPFLNTEKHTHKRNHPYLLNFDNPSDIDKISKASSKMSLTSDDRELYGA